MTDTQLCEAWRAGDESALSALYTRHEPRIRRTAHYYARRAPIGIDVEDLLGAAFEGFHRAALQWPPPDRPDMTFGWFAYIRVRDAIFDLERNWTKGGHWQDSKRADSRILEWMPAPEPETDDPAATARIKARVAKALKVLTVYERRLLKLHYEQGIPVADLAQERQRTKKHVLDVVGGALVKVRRALKGAA